MTNYNIIYVKKAKKKASVLKIISDITYDNNNMKCRNGRAVRRDGYDILSMTDCQWTGRDDKSVRSKGNLFATFLSHTVITIYIRVIYINSIRVYTNSSSAIIPIYRDNI